MAKTNGQGAPSTSLPLSTLSASTRATHQTWWWHNASGSGPAVDDGDANAQDKPRPQPRPRPQQPRPLSSMHTPTNLERAVAKQLWGAQPGSQADSVASSQETLTASQQVCGRVCWSFTSQQQQVCVCTRACDSFAPEQEAEAAAAVMNSFVLVAAARAMSSGTAASLPGALGMRAGGEGGAEAGSDGNGGGAPFVYTATAVATEVPLGGARKKAGGKDSKPCKSESARAKLAVRPLPRPSAPPAFSLPPSLPASLSLPPSLCPPFLSLTSSFSLSLPPFSSFFSLT